MKKPNNCPCYKCPDRTSDCHGLCEKYKEWCKNMQAIAQAKRDQRKKSVEEYSHELNTKKERLARRKSK